jgi:hypothetical protein
LSAVLLNLGVANEPNTSERHRNCENDVAAHSIVHFGDRIGTENAEIKVRMRLDLKTRVAYALKLLQQIEFQPKLSKKLTAHIPESILDSCTGRL